MNIRTAVSKRLGTAATALALAVPVPAAVQAQEAERGRVALELHDNITQLLCAIVNNHYRNICFINKFNRMSFIFV